MVRSNRGVGSVRPRSSKLDVLLPNQHVYCLQKTVGLYIILLSSVFFPHFFQQNKLYNIIYICTVHYGCFGLETSLSYSMVLFSITSHPPAITLGASLDLFGQETQEECSLEAMTEAYEGEQQKKRSRGSGTSIIYWNMLYIQYVVISLHIHISYIYLKLGGIS